MNHDTSIKVAVVQAAPVLFNREATVEKACTASDKPGLKTMIPAGSASAIKINTEP